MLASEQYRHFTADQAARCGYEPDKLTDHVGQGTFKRVHRGIYRLRDYPTSPREYVAAAWLAVGRDVAVVSDESALDLRDLSDITPAAVHLTVPRAQCSLGNRPPTGVTVHTTTRSWRDGELRSAGCKEIGGQGRGPKREDPRYLREVWDQLITVSQGSVNELLPE